MEDNTKNYFGVHVDKIERGFSFGICFTHDVYFNETYLYINLFKWSISIGLLNKPVTDEENY